MRNIKYGKYIGLNDMINNKPKIIKHLMNMQMGYPKRINKSQVFMYASRLREDKKDASMHIYNNNNSRVIIITTNSTSCSLQYRERERSAGQGLHAAEDKGRNGLEAQCTQNSTIPSLLLRLN